MLSLPLTEDTCVTKQLACMQAAAGFLPRPASSLLLTQMHGGCQLLGCSKSVACTHLSLKTLELSRPPMITNLS